MPIDFDAIEQTIRDIQAKTSDMGEVVRLAGNGKTTLPFIGDRVFSASEKQVLVGAYQTLKSELTALYQQLP